MKKGFTLIEILLSTSVLAVVMAAMVVTISSTFKNTRKAGATGNVSGEGTLALRSMELNIRYAKSISCTSTQLTVTKINNSVITYDIVSNRVASHSGAIVYNLTSAETVATPCSGALFTCDGGTNRTVGICFMLESANKVAGDTSTQAGLNGVQFKSQVTLRNWGL